MLSGHDYFPRTLELKKNFHNLPKKTTEKQTTLKSCIVLLKNSMAFILSVKEYGKKLRKTIKPADTIFKEKEHNINCYFWKELHLAYRSTYNEGDKIKHSWAFQCHYCHNFYGVKPKFDKHTENCGGIPGIIYNFSTQNLVSFEGNIGYKGDLLWVALMDFETTALTDNCFNPEQKRILYAITHI